MVLGGGIECDRIVPWTNFSIADSSEAIMH